MIRPVVEHVAAAGADRRDFDELVGAMTATEAVTGRATRADLVHAHGLDALDQGRREARRLRASLVVSLTPDDVGRVCADPARQRSILRAVLVVVTSVDDVDRLAAVEVRRVRIVPFDRLATDTLDAELGTCAADLEEHYLAVLRTGLPAAQRRPIDHWPTITVVVVTWNRRELLQRCLAALAAQTYPADKVEIVVIDNASTDGSDAVLDAWSGPGRSVVTLAEHVVPGRARNAGVKDVTTEIVAFTDDDCFPTPGWLAALVAGFRDGIAIVQGRTIADPAGDLTPLSRTQWTPAEYGAYETANIAYRREVLSSEPFDVDFGREVARVLGPRIGGEPFGEDAELAWRVKRAGGASRFSSTAVVHHVVWPFELRYLLRRAVITSAFPVLVQRVPELRDAMFWHRWFLSKRNAQVVLAGVGLAAATRRPAAVALVAPYLWSRVRPLQRGRKARLRALPVLALRDTVEEAALVYGSVRARNPVL